MLPQMPAPTKRYTNAAMSKFFPFLGFDFILQSPIISITKTGTNQIANNPPINKINPSIFLFLINSAAK